MLGSFSYFAVDLALPLTRGFEFVFTKLPDLLPLFFNLVILIHIFFLGCNSAWCFYYRFI